MKVPLILASLAEDYPLFKEISKNPYLRDVSISKSIDSMDLKEAGSSEPSSEDYRNHSYGNK